MGKRLLEWWRWLKEWMREKAMSAFLSALLWLSVLLFPLLVSSSLWVMFGDTIGCDACWIHERLGVTEKAAALKTLGLAIAGIMAFWGVVAANRRSDAMADTAKATEDGNRQRAFKDGVKHLGSSKASVRQGGAHALFHLALEDEGLRLSIAGVLCAHIQETTGDKDYQEQNKGKPSIEMQSLLRLLFTTETVDEERLTGFWQDIAPDLDGGYFCGVELESAQFRGAKLNSAQFKGAKLTGARFQGARLDRAQFQRAWLRAAEFQGAWMRGTRFHAAHLTDTRFQGADLGWAQFQGAQLFGSQFQGAWLCATEFQQAQFGTEKYQVVSSQEAEAALGPRPERMEKSELQGISSTLPYASPSFEQRIKDRVGKVDKEFDFSKVVFSGGVTEELLADVKAALEVSVDRASWFFDVFDDPAAKEELIRNLESEIGQPESHTPPKEVIAGSYGKEDAERWIREFRKAMATAPKTNQAT